MILVTTLSLKATIMQTLIELGVPFDVNSELAIELSAYLPEEEKKDIKAISVLI